MAEVLRLQIIYETSQAASAANRLAGVNRTAHTGIRQLESGMRALATSALGIPGPIGRIAEGLLKFGTGGAVTLTVVAGLGAIAGAFKLANDEANRLAKQNDALAATLGGKFGGERVALLTDLDKAREQLKKLNQEANNLWQGGGGVTGWWQRLRATVIGPGPGVEAKQAQTAAATAANLVLQIENAIKQSLEDQVAAREKALKAQRDQLFLERSEQSVLDARDRSNLNLRAFRAGRGLDTIRFGQPSVPARPLDTPFGRSPDRTRSLDTPFGQGIGLGKGSVDWSITNKLTTQQQRIVDSWSDGLHTMQGSLEEFLVTGKFVFQQLIDDLLRIAFRAATDQFVDKAIKGVLDVAQKSSGFRKQMSGG